MLILFNTLSYSIYYHVLIPLRECRLLLLLWPHIFLSSLTNFGQQIIKANKKKSEHIFNCIFLEFFCGLLGRSPDRNFWVHFFYIIRYRHNIENERCKQSIFICDRILMRFLMEKSFYRERGTKSYLEIVQTLAKLIEKKVHFSFYDISIVSVWIYPDSILLFLFVIFFFFCSLLNTNNIAMKWILTYPVYFSIRQKSFSGFLFLVCTEPTKRIFASSIIMMNFCSVFSSFFIANFFLSLLWHNFKSC